MEKITIESITIKYISCMFVLHSFNYFDLILKGKDSTVELRKQFMDKCENSLIIFIPNTIAEHRVEYDETLWPPDILYGSRQRLYLKVRPGYEMYIFDLDFTKDIRTGVSCLTSGGKLLVDIFK